MATFNTNDNAGSNTNYNAGSGSMRNAADEFADHASTIPSQLLCAFVAFVPSYGEGEDTRKFILPVDYTPKQLSAFLTGLSFEYDAGYGDQHLYGTMWFDDGTWSEREEYDGSEWWEHMTPPVIPRAVANGMPVGAYAPFKADEPIDTTTTTLGDLLRRRLLSAEAEAAIRTLLEKGE